jgi:cullin-associated NEDD8-dissociated protein 1
VDNSIPAMALRTVVITLPRPVPGVAATKEVSSAYDAISRVLVPRLVGKILIPTPTNKLAGLPAVPPGMLDLESGADIDPEAVDVLIEVIRCFGPLLQPREVEAFQRRMKEQVRW